MMEEPLDLLLIDGHSLLFRAYFALPPLTTPDGTPANGVYGFASMLMNVIAQQHPRAVIAAFDPKGPTFRTEQYPAYKGHRPEVPDDFVPQTPMCHELVAAFGIPVIEMTGYEADDVIGTLSREAKEEGKRVGIVTGDMDSLQLVDDNVHVLSTKKGISDIIVYSPKEVEEKYGFGPEFVIDYKALAGDSSDNIPGVPGIGPKTATTLISTWGHLDDILAALESMPDNRTTRLLREHRDLALVSRDLATIRRDVDIHLRDIESAYHPKPREVAEVFHRFGFRTLLTRLPNVGIEVTAEGTPGEEKETHAVPVQLSSIMLEDLGDAAEEDDCKSFLGALAKISGNALRIAHHVAGSHWILAITDPQVAISCSFDFATIGSQMRMQCVEAFLECTQRGITNDLKLLARTLDHAARMHMHSWDGWDDVVLEGHLATHQDRLPSLVRMIEEEKGEEVHEDAGGDDQRGLVGYLPAFHAAMSERLSAEKMEDLYRTLELPLAPILGEMEERGICLDVPLLKTLSSEMYGKLAALELSIYEHAGKPFNVGSTQQLATVLFDELGLAAGRKTKTGRSTDAETLEILRGSHPIIEEILEWRLLSKLKSTYVDALPLLCDRESRVHSTFNQLGAITGRLSSTDPNLQNIPARTDWGMKIRSAFVAPEGYTLLSADYSQIELRILAHMCDDPNLRQAFHAGEDIHTRTAAEVYGVEPEDVTSDMRRIAKVVNFGILYGLSEFGLARDTRMGQADARTFIAQYFARFPAVQGYLESVREHAHKYGWVSTLFGRRRYFSEINSRIHQRKLSQERMAVNMPLQGTAADIIKKAMIEMEVSQPSRKTHERMLVQVHDELLFEVPILEIEAVQKDVHAIMEHVVELEVPLLVEVKHGTRWGAMVPLPRG
ncbi:MAG: DNA polymerase I [Candidatus Dormibacteria bacterium]